MSDNTYQYLPEILSLPVEDRDAMLIKKLNQCKVVFDFKNPLVNVMERKVKQDTLVELVDYISVTKEKFSAVVIKEIIDMVSINLFRGLPPRIDPPGIPYDPEEDEPILRDSWAHLQIVYEVVLKLLESPRLDANVGKHYFDQKFVNELLSLFNSEDHRERNLLKTILHRLYGKFLTLRAYIRRVIRNIFLSFIYEDTKNNGISEFLEILGSIINGFTVPIKKEHKEFLFRALLPLHKPKFYTIYSAHLSYCVALYVEKEPSLAREVFQNIINFWPHCDSIKEALFVKEVEEILCVLEAEDFQPIQELVFTKMSHCMTSSHFQIAEQALSFFNNEYLLSLIADNVSVLLPILFPALYANAVSHWNKAIKEMGYSALRLFKDLDEEIFRKVVHNYVEESKSEQETEEYILGLWSNLIVEVDPEAKDNLGQMVQKTKHYNTLDYHDSSGVTNLLEDENMKSAPPQTYYPSYSSTTSSYSSSESYTLSTTSSSYESDDDSY